jgi:hypothetical protein
MHVVCRHCQSLCGRKPHLPALVFLFFFPVPVAVADRAGPSAGVWPGDAGADRLQQLGYPDKKLQSGLGARGRKAPGLSGWTRASQQRCNPPTAPCQSGKEQYSVIDNKMFGKQTRNLGALPGMDAGCRTGKVWGPAPLQASRNPQLGSLRLQAAVKPTAFRGLALRTLVRQKNP